MMLLSLLACEPESKGNCPAEPYETGGIMNYASECVAQGLCALRCSEGICGQDGASNEVYWCEECDKLAGIIGYGEGYYRVTLEPGGGFGVSCEEHPDAIDIYECPVEEYHPTGSVGESATECSEAGLCAFYCNEEVCGESANEGTGIPYCESCEQLNQYTGHGGGRFWMNPIPGGVELECWGPLL